MAELYEWQKECLELIRGKNAIVSAPTNAGKTRVAYLWMDVAGARDGKHKIIYTVPIRALANQKTDELIELYGKNLVGMETGDVKRREDAPILVCTQEIYTKKYSQKDAPMKLVIDEFHYIFLTPDRARVYVDGIAKAKRTHQILIMSATLGNPQKVKDYLYKVTGKDFVLYHTDFRPTRLNITDAKFNLEEIPPYSLVYIFNKSSVDRMAKYMSTKLPPLPLNKRRRIKLLAENYKVNLEKFPEVMHGVARYHAKLTYTERRWIEHLIREGFIHVCIATNAVGVGVNLPFRWVLFGGVTIPTKKGLTRVLSKVEFLQFAGRAGRKEYFDEGFVGYLEHSYNGLLGKKSEDYQEYIKLKEKPLEEPSVVLNLNVEAIVKGDRTPEEELEYVLTYSDPPPNKKELQAELERIKTGLAKLTERELKFLKRFYVSDLSLWDNIRVAKAVLRAPVYKHRSADNKSYKVRLLSSKRFMFLQRIDTDEAKRLMLVRKVLKTLNGRSFEKVKLRCTDIHEVEEQIRAMDPLLLEVEA
ncbi:MAG: DEAD/DEAH box helicase [Aquificaceae bacterium]|nr:DEAD/DEAH box helicase [Aquificaceae bacterium]